MNTNKAIAVILEDINRLEQQIQTIALADEKNYDYFLNEINKLKQDLFNIDDSYQYDDIVKIISNSEKLNHEYNYYLVSGHTEVFAELKLLSEEPENVSGNDAKKRYRVNLYRSILQDLIKKTGVEWNKLEQLREKWEGEKNGNMKYSPIEIDLVEQEFATLFLKYQIKECANNKCLPTQRLKKFCDKDKYDMTLRSKLLETIKRKKQVGLNTMELEQFFMNNSFEELLYSECVWKAISGAPEVNLSALKNVLEKETSTENVTTPLNENGIPQLNNTTTNTQNLPAVIENKEMFTFNNGKNNVVQTIVEYDLFGRKFRFKKNFRITKDGRIHVSLKWKSRIIAAYIPEGVERLSGTSDRYAELGFSYCSKLEYVHFPSSLERIEYYAFYQCKKLRYINIPENLKEIGQCAFSECEQLESIDLSKTKIIRLSIAAFRYCHDLKKVELPNQLRYIEDSCFAFSGIETINLPETLVRLGKDAFASSQLTTIDIPGGLGQIDEYGFENCANLQSVNINKGTRYIGEGAFKGCSHLTNVIFHDGHIEIKNKAFSDCIRLDEIKYPGDIKYAQYSLPSAVKLVHFEEEQSVGENASEDRDESVDQLTAGESMSQLDLDGR